MPGRAYDALGIGIPYHVQSFFVRLREFATMESRSRVTVADVDTVYRAGLLGPSGQNDLAHYETRLHDALDDENRSIAMQILGEAATQEVFTASARARLSEFCSRVVDDAPGRIAEVLDALAHDEYLRECDDDYRFSFRLLKDWWAVRFGDHHVPIERRSPNGPEMPAQ